ncbi:MAG TPA: acetate--CoA ligase family protein [Candidatus Dormibacteraeota bacterium]|nr:acetate--CoA ligase family protein [Candidatus Dormibacteraeota bacterium]
MPAGVRPERDFRPLFDPRSVAIVGASADPAKWGNTVARMALRGERRRRVFLVNRSGQEILGRSTFRSLGDLPELPEMVVIAIGAAGFEQAVTDALAAGARVIVGITAGLGESGDDGLAVEARVLARVRAAGATLVGPNCLGVADTGSDLLVAYSEFAPGAVGLISQSGNLALELAVIAREAGIGFSRFVSVGNQADLEVAELVEELATHEPTRVIAAYVEDFRDGRTLALAALQARDAGKPVILLTVGTSPAGARAARTHTGAMISAAAAIDAACQASGMLRVTTPREMIELAQGLLMPHLPRGRRVGIVGDGGGHVALAADLVAGYGLDVPMLSSECGRRVGATLPPAAATGNPVDLAGGGEQDLFNYAKAVQVLSESGEVDAILLTGFFGGYGVESADSAGAEVEVARRMGAATDACERSLVVQTMYAASPASAALRSMGVPVYADISAAVRVLSNLVGWRERMASGVPALPEPSAAPPVREGYFEARELLAGIGIPFVDAHQVHTLDEARAAATRLGFPVVLKALGSSHKSDAAGVRLGISRMSELDAAFDDLMSRLEPAAFSVERMAPAGDGVELLIGVRRDRSFGPVVVIGLGGLYAEVLRDLAVGLAPVGIEPAERMIRSLRGSSLLLGPRGGEPLDIRAAAHAAARLSELAARRPGIAEIEINPLLVGRDGVLALDARVAGS